jgi:hypothetical protein
MSEPVELATMAAPSRWRTTRKTISISPALLPDALRQRFEAMLPVVAKRSVVEWELSTEADADVVLREHAVSGDDRISVYVRDDVVFAGAAGALRVPLEFRVNALMDVLELAAARVLDRRDRAVRAVQRPSMASSERLYQLKYWIITPDRMPLAVLCALAGMTRRPVSREWLMVESRLSAAGVDLLLMKLERLGALHVDPTISADRPPRARTGLASRLRQWLRGGRAASPMAASR